MEYPVHNNSDAYMLAGGDSGVEVADHEVGRLLVQADASSLKPMVLVTHSVVSVDLPRPRDEDVPEFNALRRHPPELIY